jgi:hypothetical protein
MIILEKSSVGRRVRLLQGENWCGAVRDGNKTGRVKGWNAGVLRYDEDRNMYHVVFDKVEAKQGYIFGVGGEGKESDLFDFID